MEAIFLPEDNNNEEDAEKELAGEAGDAPGRDSDLVSD